MRILVIAQQLPYPADTGGKIRHFQLYSRLARDHHITWVAPVGAEAAAGVSGSLTFCDQVVPLPPSRSIRLPTSGWPNLLARFIAHLHWRRLFEFCFGYVYADGLCWVQGTPERRAAVQQIADSSSWDSIICESIGSVELAPHAQTVPVLVSLFDVQSELFRRLRHVSAWTWEDRLFCIPELLKIRRYERQHYRQFDAAIAVSEHDKALLARLCPGLEIDVIDNGVDTAQYQSRLEAEIENRLAFVGSYGYSPNRDAVVYFAEQMLPRIRAVIPDTTLMVVGKDAPAELGRISGVDVIGAVPDVRPYLYQASVVVVPLRVGSGTRIKILEAMAAGRAIVTTSVGVEGLRVQNGRHLVIADGPKDFAEAVTQLLWDPGLRQEIGANARKLVEQEYDWSMLAQRLEGVVAGARKRHGR
jgi:glycosyltransferase involved in cell wall biosynthesis